MGHALSKQAHLYTKTMSCPTFRVLARFDVAPGVPTILQWEDDQLTSLSAQY